MKRIHCLYVENMMMKIIKDQDLAEKINNYWKGGLFYTGSVYAFIQTQQNRD